MFLRKNLLGGVPFGAHYYQTSDAPEQVLEPGYFNAAYQQLDRLDRITVKCMADERDPEHGAVTILELIVSARYFAIDNRTSHMAVVLASRTEVPDSVPPRAFTGVDPAKLLADIDRQAEWQRPR